MKLRLWIAEQDTDSIAYNVIGKTKKAVIEEMKRRDHQNFLTLSHVELEYKDAFDLFDMVTGEGGGRGSSYPFTKLKEIDLTKRLTDED